MRGMVPPDPQTSVSQTRFAVVYIPKRNRKRFPANCVEIYETRLEALRNALPDEKKFAAIVIGPSKSSEGQSIYYLGEML